MYVEAVEVLFGVRTAIIIFLFQDGHTAVNLCFENFEAGAYKLKHFLGDVVAVRVVGGLWRYGLGVGGVCYIPTSSILPSLIFVLELRGGFFP